MVQEKNNVNSFILFLIWLIVIQLSAIYLFTSGFFLTRHEVPYRSTCNSSAHYESRELHSHLNGAGCWSDSRFTKAVIIIIDALRIDFTAFSSKKGIKGEKFYLNHLPVVAEVLGEYNTEMPGHGRLFRFEADPPTVTMQRLKGLTTGSLPTFIDFRLNFASPHIEEDNIIDQMVKAGKRLTFMGDDTWTALYPIQFKKSFPYESFNTRDLHTVDNGVLEHLQPELSSKDWDVLIAHFLGVDHVGHTFGPASPAMEDKLGQMDLALRDIFHTVDDDTLVLVMGDHGMTNDGNHGGATSEETGAALLVYSKTPLSSAVPTDAQTELKSEKTDEPIVWKWDEDDGRLKAHSIKGPLRAIAQVDLVPTLSLLLGLPIPYANLGALVPELFVVPHGSADRSPFQEVWDPHEPIVDPLAINAQQVWNYLQTYAATAHLPERELDNLKQSFEKAQHTYSKYRAGKGTNAAEVCKLYQYFLSDALDLGKSIWTQYNIPLMAWGTGIFFLSLLCLLQQLFLVSASSSRNTSRVFNHSIILWSLLHGAFVAAVSALLMPSFLDPLSSLGVACTISCLEYCCWLFFQIKPQDVFKDLREVSQSWGGCATVVFLFMYTVGLFSNSFIEEEHKVLLFLSTSSCLGLAIDAYMFGLGWKNSALAIAAALSLRLGSMLEGHGQHVRTTFTTLGSVLPLVGLLLLEVHRIRASKIARFVRIFWLAGQGSSYLMICLYWFLEATDTGHIMVFGRIKAAFFLPRSVYCLGILSLACVGPLYFKISKRIQKDEALVQEVCLAIYASLCPPLILLLGAASPLSILLMTINIRLISQISRSLNSTRPSGLLSKVFSATMVWILCGRSFFYFTGHHSQFNRLQYSSAFIGFDDFSFIRSGVLLFFNTFGTEIQTIVGLPLLLELEKDQNCWLFMGFTLQTVLFNTIRTFATTCNIIIQRRHLMLWAIFAPKFVFEGTIHIVLSFFILICCTVYIQMIHSSLKKSSAVEKML